MFFQPFIKEAILLIVLISGIPLLVASAVGLVVSILQAATQINEQTTPFLIKFFTVLGVLALGGRWFVGQIIRFVQELLSSIAYIS